MGPKRIKDEHLDSSGSTSKEQQKLKRMRNESFNVKVRSWKGNPGKNKVKKVRREMYRKSPSKILTQKEKQARAKLTMFISTTVHQKIWLSYRI